MTPEEKAFCAKMKREFTVEKLIEYIEDDVPKVPMGEALAKLDAILGEDDEPVAEAA